MEGNRDEAEKCIGIARDALEAGDRDRALRFLSKAQKLYPTDTARGEQRGGGTGGSPRSRNGECQAWASSEGVQRTFSTPSYPPALTRNPRCHQGSAFFHSTQGWFVFPAGLHGRGW